MKYEIPREAFKQRLSDRLNFVFIDLLSAEKTPAKFENIVHMNYGAQFKTDFAAQYPNKNQNVVVYSLQKGDETPAKAANDLSEAGYNFVYFYNGTPDDVVLDKGLN
jgi:Ni2+-binding GTPase involved in maturation of urease and hydrogenase